MSRNIITYNLNSEVATVNGVYLNKEQSIEITKIIEEKDQRIAELEKEIEELKDINLDLKSDINDLRYNISNLTDSAVRCTAIDDEPCIYIIENGKLKQENAELKAKLQEAKRKLEELN